MSETSTRGKFVWYDLMTTDPKGAEAFYKNVAGWTTEQWEAMPYTMWKAGNSTIGGIMPMPDAAAGPPPHWIAYIAVPDVDASMALIASLGGRTLMAAKDIPGVGRFALATDPQGAAFAVFTPLGTAPGQDHDPAIGEFSWHELSTSDYAAAFAFYEKVFGWHKQAEHDMGPMGIYLLFSRNGRELGGMFTMDPSRKMPPNWLQYIRVDNADRAVERVTAAGGTVLNGPMDVPGGDRIAQCMDPQGAAFALHSKGIAG
jgi:predicted enzyme related to lactoylglutathione lyase